jgi:ferredoxin-NADP reductase
MAEKKAFDLVCRVISNRMVTPTVFELTFSTDPVITFKAGQFISIVIPGAGPKGRDLRRAYSIASPPERARLELCVKLVEGGPGTTYLHSLKEGDTFKGVAPYGDFVFKTPPERHAVFFGTGTGVAPFRAMILSDAYRAAPPKSALCLLGVRDEEELLYVPELKSRSDVKVVTAVSRPKSTGFDFTGRVTDYVRKHEKDVDWANSDFYLCGAGAMIDEVKQILASHGVTKEHIHLEVYYKTPAS